MSDVVHTKQHAEDTIAAIATASGRGGVGIVRISGPLSQIIAETLLKTKLTPRHAHYLPFYDETGKQIDEGIAIFFSAPHSFTGEDVLEFQAHGGPVVLDRILQATIACNARLAKPGEFSERAFLNGKIDLVQAEAIADLIDASSKQAAHSALLSFQGEFSKRIDQLVESIIKLRMYVEAAIDFPEEEIDFLANTKISEDLNHIIDQLCHVKATAQQGSLLREGIRVVIAGRPNAGKSSLLNTLSGYEAAIVTDIAGTTRDVLKEAIQIDGLPLHIIDTAGLRESQNAIEKEGIFRAKEEIQKADIILLIVDVTQNTNIQKLQQDFLGKGLKDQPIVVIQNKIDLIDESPRIEGTTGQTTIYLSAKEKQGLDLLTTCLKQLAAFESYTEGLFMARRRHLDAIERAEQVLRLGQEELLAHKAGELLAEELRQAQRVLSEITGQFTTEDLLDRIFSSFCIGK